MTAKGSRKKVDAIFGAGRLEAAKAHRMLAAQALTSLQDGQWGNAVISNIVLSAIGYTDALTAKFSGEINQQDHLAAGKTLRNALGNMLPREQENALRRILDNKDSAHYGAKQYRRPEAQHLLDLLIAFGDWAEEIIKEHSR